MRNRSPNNWKNLKVKFIDCYMHQDTDGRFRCRWSGCLFILAEGNPQHNPLWHFYNQSVLPYSTFKALPEGDEVIKDDFTAPIVATSTPATYALTSQPTSAVTTSSSMSSPLSSIANSPMQTFVNGGLQLQTYQQPLPHHDSNMTIGSSFYPAAFSYPQQHFVQPSSGFVFNPMTSPPPTSSPLGYSPSWSSSSGRKRSQSHMVVSTHPSPPEDQPPMKRHHASLPGKRVIHRDDENTHSFSFSH